MISRGHLHDSQGYHCTKTTAGMQFFKKMTVSMDDERFLLRTSNGMPSRFWAVCKTYQAYVQSRQVCEASCCQVMSLSARHRRVAGDPDRGGVFSSNIIVGMLGRILLPVSMNRLPRISDLGLTFAMCSLRILCTPVSRNSSPR